MFEQAFKNIDQILHTDSGSATELDYVEQTSWILFLKYLDDLDEIKKTEAALAEYKEFNKTQPIESDFDQVVKGLIKGEKKRQK